MTLELQPLNLAIERLEASLSSDTSSTTDITSSLDREVRLACSELIADLSIPNMTADPISLEGGQAALALFERIESFPDEMEKTQSDLLARIGAFDNAVGRVSMLSDACEDMLEKRQSMLADLRGEIASLIIHLETEIERVVSEAGELLIESFTETFSANGEQAFLDIGSLLDQSLEDCSNLADQSAGNLESEALQITDGFVGKAQEVIKDVVEEGVRQLLERQLVDVIEDLSLSQSVSAATAQLNTTIATAAPNIVVALKAVSAVKRLLELAKL